ncbi:MAG: hypothetical protein V1694_06680 [Candidatus Eisenbacteria bacterium]
MRDWGRNRILWLVFVLALSGATGTASAESVTVSSRHQETFTAADLSRPVVYLSCRPLVSSSETVTLDGALLRCDADYSVDYLEGIIYLTRAAAPGSSICVGYSVLPFALKPSYQHREIQEQSHDPLGAAKIQPILKPRKSSYDLKASGTKTISIEAGSLSDFRVSQALNLAIGGKVGDAVEVRGVLSDKDMTLSERTSTTELKDLDRVFMEVRSTRAYARVGDLEINEAPGELLSFRRSLTGFLGDASFGSERVMLSGAQSRSRYETAEVTGREGIAGPYFLSGPERLEIAIVTGTDKVWLDGESMKRGRNADYVIDYEKGEIYFNPSRLVRDGARIVVDFESRSESERKQFYFARSNLKFGARAGISVSFLNEGTLPQAAAGPDPLGVSPENLGAQAQGWLDGAKYVGLGNGDYFRVKQDSLVYYEYAGEGAGEYDVSFTFVGEGKGIYSYVFSDRWGREVHIYTGLGAYVDRIREAPKLMSQVVHLGASARPSDWLELTSEFAQSKGHKEAQDGAWRLSEDRAYTVGAKSNTDLPRVGGHGIGGVELALKRRWVGPGYLAFDRLRSPGILERWAEDPGDGFEATNELSFGYRLGAGVKTSFELGSMGTRDGDSRRTRYAVDVGNARLGLAATSEVARVESGARERGIRRSGLAVRVPVKTIDLEFGRTSDLKDRLTDDQSQMRVEYYSLARVRASRSTAALSLTKGTEARSASGAAREAYSSSLDGKLQFETDQGRRFAFRGQVAHRRVSYVPPVELGRRQMTSADFGLNLRDILVLSSVALDYGLASTLTSVYSSKLVKVGAGGDYDSLGNYLPGSGGYEITRYETGRQPVTRMKANFVVEAGLKGKIMLEKALSLRSTLELEGESSKDNIGHLALPNPAFVTRADQVVFGRANLNEELVLNRFRGVTVAMVARATKTTDRRCSERTEQDLTTQFQTRVSSTSLNRLNVALEGRLGRVEKSIETSSSKIQPSSRTWSVSAGFERFVANSFRGRFMLEILGDRRSEPRSSLTQGSISPGFTLFLGPLRCDTGLNVRRLLRSRSLSPYELRSRDLLDWNSRINLRQGRYTSLALEYVGRRTRGLDTVHNVKASLSATF